MLKNRCEIVPPNSPANPLSTPAKFRCGHTRQNRVQVIDYTYISGFHTTLFWAPKRVFPCRQGDPRSLSREESHRRGRLLAHCGAARIGELRGAGHRPDGEHAVLAADFDLVARKRGKVEPGARHRLLGDDQLAAIGLGQGFEPARGVDGIADRGDRGGGAITHLADDHRPDMDTDADAQWLIELAAQRTVELFEALGHQPSGGERLPAGRAGIPLDPEQRHNAVADEFVDPPSRRLDGASHRSEIAVENKYDIVGEPSFGQPGAPADIGEQDRDLPLAALREVDPPPPVCRVRKSRQQRCHLDRAARAQLAGEAHIGPGADAPQHARFLFARLIEAAAFPANPYAARRAAAPPPAYMGMRNAGCSARLEDGGAGGGLDRETT